MVDTIAAMIAEAVSARAKEAQARAAAARPGAPRPVAPARPPAAPAAAPAPRPPRAPMQFQPIPDPASPVPSGLLSAFGSSEGLLAGIVLSEALSPPIALRRDEPRF
jgi:hypothetical protein